MGTEKGIPCQLVCLQESCKLLLLPCDLDISTALTSVVSCRNFWEWFAFQSATKTEIEMSIIDNEQFSFMPAGIVFMLK